MRHSAHDLALETRDVELSLAGDHEVGIAHPIGEVDFVSHQFEPWNEPTTQSHESTGQTTGGSRTGNCRHIDSVFLPIHLHESFESSLEHPHLSDGRSLLRREHSSRVDEKGVDIARDEELDSA